MSSSSSLQTFTPCSGRIDSDEVVRRLTHLEQRPVPPELRMVSPELLSPELRPAPRRGLDDHDAQAKAGNDPVALREPVYLAIGSGWRSSLVRPAATGPTRAARVR